MSGTVGAAPSRRALRPESVHVIAQHRGVDRLSDGAAVEMVNDAETQLRLVVQEACKFMFHSKRERLVADDCEHALRLLGANPVFGYTTQRPLRFVRLGDGVFEVMDDEVDLSDIVKAAMPLAPLAPHVSAHWLVVDGAQPNVPENPPPLTAGALSAAAGGPAHAATPTVVGPPPQKRKRRHDATDGMSVEPPATAGVEVTGRVHHQLSTELQVFFDKLVKVLRDCDERAPAVLRTLRMNSGLHQLVPYLIQFIAGEVRHNLNNLRVLRMLLRAADALLANKHMRTQLELYLHQLIPAIITCVVASTLGDRPEIENHWALRSFAAQVAAKVLEQYGELYTDLRPRIIKTLYGAFCDAAKPHCTHYGAIVGISAMGVRHFQKWLLPKCVEYVARLQRVVYKAGTSASKATSERSARKRRLRHIAATHCMDAMLRAAAGWLRTTTGRAAGGYMSRSSELLLTSLGTPAHMRVKRIAPIGHKSPPGVRQLGVGAPIGSAEGSHAPSIGIGMPNGRLDAPRAGLSSTASELRARVLNKALAAAKASDGKKVALAIPRRTRRTTKARAKPETAEAPSRDLEQALVEVCGEATIPYVAVALTGARVGSFVL